MLNTKTAELIEGESIYVFVDDVWFSVDEPALLEHLNLAYEDIFPLTWKTDKPLKKITWKDIWVGFFHKMFLAG